MKKTLFIKNAAIMTSTGTILRIAGIFFKVWLAAAVGSEGIGLYHIVFSLYTLAATFASSGITVAVTRLIADEMAIGNKQGVARILRKAMTVSLIIALITFIILLFGSDFISAKILGDARAALSVSFFAFSLPFMAISSVIKGYFAARRKAGANSGAVLLEQALRILLCLFLVKRFSRLGVGGAVAGVMAGDSLAEIAACIFILFLFRADFKRLKEGEECSSFTGYRQLLRIAVPITAGRYATSLLRTAENISVPKALMKAGGDYAKGLSLFGAIKGMALPVLFFPSSVLNAFSSLLVPEMSEALARHRPELIKHSVSRVLKTTWLIGIVFGCIFFFAGERIGSFLYSDSASGELIHILAPLVPLMYLDSICDGILKGIDKQLFTFRTAVCDSLLRLIAVIVFVPKFSITGFLVIMFLSNILTCSLNLFKTLSEVKIKPRLFTTVLLPLCAAIGFSMLFSALYNFINISILYIIIYSLSTLLAYMLFLWVFKLF